MSEPSEKAIPTVAALEEGAQVVASSARWFILAGLITAAVMEVLDSTIVNIALPSAQNDLHFSNADRQWIVTAYSLAFGTLLLLGGRIGYRKALTREFKLDVFGGVDNAFNTKYSLGNDFNAAAGRYYNGAPGVNYYAGISLNLALK